MFFYGLDLRIGFLSVLLFFQILLLAGCETTSSQKNTEEGWGETQSLSVATDWAGIGFQSPDETFVTNDGKSIELTTYRYKTGIVEALYKGEDYEVIFRKSDSLEGEALAGDDRTYSKEWDTNLNGTTIHCHGNEAGINIAYYDMGDEHYAVTVHLGDEDKGLTEEELSLFLMSLLPLRSLTSCTMKAETLHIPTALMTGTITATCPRMKPKRDLKD